MDPFTPPTIRASDNPRTRRGLKLAATEGAIKPLEVNHWWVQSSRPQKAPYNVRYLPLRRVWVCDCEDKPAAGEHCKHREAVIASQGADSLVAWHVERDQLLPLRAWLLELLFTGNYAPECADWLLGLWRAVQRHDEVAAAVRTQPLQNAA